MSSVRRRYVMRDGRLEEITRDPIIDGRALVLEVPIGPGSIADRLMRLETRDERPEILDVEIRCVQSAYERACQEGRLADTSGLASAVHRLREIRRRI